MNLYLFSILIFLLLIKLFFKKEILNYLHGFGLTELNQKYITNILILLLILVILIGLFNPGATREKFKQISKAYQEMRTPEKQQRPNPMFDVDTYPDSTLW